MLNYFVLIFLILLNSVLPGCSGNKTVVKEGTIYSRGQTVSEKKDFKITLKVYNDPEIDYSLFKTFRMEFRASDTFNPLLDKHLTNLVRESLIRNGFVEDKGNPDFIVMGSHHNTFVPDRDPGIRSESGSFSGISGGKHFSGTYHSGDGLVTAIVKAKMAQRYWIHDFGMVFLNPKSNQVIWIGNANAYVRVDDIRETVPDIINTLIMNYPVPKVQDK